MPSFKLVTLKFTLRAQISPLNSRLTSNFLLSNFSSKSYRHLKFNMSETKLIILPPKETCSTHSFPISFNGNFILLVPQQKLWASPLTLLSHLTSSPSANPVDHFQMHLDSDHLPPLPLSSPWIIASGSLLISVHSPLSLLVCFQISSWGEGREWADNVMPLRSSLRTWPSL